MKCIKLSYLSLFFFAHNRFTVQWERINGMEVQILFNIMMYKQNKSEVCAVFVSPVKSSEVCF